MCVKVKKFCGYVSIRNIFLLVSLDEGMDQGFTCTRNVCYRRKARVLLKKVFAYLPLLVSECIYPYLWPDGMPFFKPKQQNKKPYPGFNLRYLWLIFWQPKMYYLNDLMILIMITLMFVLVTFNGHSWAKQTIKTQLVIITC